MIRERSFVRRGQIVPLKEVTELVALHRGRRTRAGAGGVQAAAELPVLIDAALLRPFQQAGWEFMLREAAPRAGKGRQARVFLGSGGQLLLAGNTLVVGFHGEPSVAEVNTLLAPFGGRVLEGFGFAPDLFRVAVEVTKDRDSLDVAAELVRCPRVRFAEPELIEAFGGR